MRGFLKNMALFCVAVLIALAALEGLSRLVYPVQYGHKSFDLDGNPIYPATDFLSVVPSLTYRQRAQEFDVITTHTAEGTRGPAGSFMDTENPEILFLGDSMTYGVGLADEQTIPYLYCKEAHTTCANLGRPGSGTREALDILEYRLNENGWRPLHVILIMNVMTAAQFGGNDLTDNLVAARRQAQQNTQAAETSVDTPVTKADQPAHHFTVPTHNDVLAHSNLARVGYYIFAPMIRRFLSPGMDANELEEALSLTQDNLAHLEMLSQRYAFTYQIFIVHPMQDLTRATWQQTRDAINAIAPHGKIFDTAPALLEQGGDPARFYYPLDGHVRPRGAELIARYMLDNKLQ